MAGVSVGGMDTLPDDDRLPEPVEWFAPWRWRRSDQLGLAFLFFTIAVFVQGCLDQLQFFR